MIYCPGCPILFYELKISWECFLYESFDTANSDFYYLLRANLGDHIVV